MQRLRRSRCDACVDLLDELLPGPRRQTGDSHSQRDRARRRSRKTARSGRATRVKTTYRSDIRTNFSTTVIARSGPRRLRMAGMRRKSQAYAAGADCSKTVAPLVELPAYSTIIGATFYPAQPRGTFAFPAAVSRRALCRRARILAPRRRTATTFAAACRKSSRSRCATDGPAIAVDWHDPARAVAYVRRRISAGERESHRPPDRHCRRSRRKPVRRRRLRRRDLSDSPSQLASASRARRATPAPWPRRLDRWTMR